MSRRDPAHVRSREMPTLLRTIGERSERVAPPLYQGGRRGGTRPLDYLRESPGIKLGDFTPQVSQQTFVPPLAPPYKGGERLSLRSNCIAASSLKRIVQLGFFCLFVFIQPAAYCAEPDSFVPSAERGYKWLTTKAYLPADFDQEVFDELWKVWPKDLREEARNATPTERRKLAFTRYGLMESPDHPGTGTAWGYVSDGSGGWVMNCLSCHGGQVNGQVTLGLPNSNYGLETLVEDVRVTKLRLNKKLTHMDLAQLGMPLGGSHGTTNSVMFGVALEAKRDLDMKVLKDYVIPDMLHHDLDAPPWWNVKKKSRLYYDGMVKKHHRPLIQFVLLPRNDEKVLASWENDYRDLLAWIESLKSPKYPWSIDDALASSGRTIFNENCAKCHGTYGDNPTYPEKIVSLEVLGTDPCRLVSLSPKYRENFQHSWLSNYNKTDPIWQPDGYVAPPLDGIWASAPYLHNGSVPTLWHLLHADERPKVWKRTPTGYDQQRLGLEISESEAVPANLPAGTRRQYFDTSKQGKSAAGHRFPESLSEDQKRAVLEYLKTL